MVKMRRGMILTAGPSITSMEIDLVMDAVTHGWNTRHSEFIRSFQQAFAEYIGVKYAMCTSSCTGALHLSMAAYGLKTGDEVLVPENTWVATGMAPKYVGANPVFVDIEKDTWCISPPSIEKHITARTKAIIPVHLYGNPCDMDQIMDIAKKYNLIVIEDAAPSTGSEWKGMKTGSFGDSSAFSFQGAKLMVAGEGGMFCTNDEAIYKKAQYLNDYAVDTNKSFWVDEIGFKYRMSNLQAAIGLGQLRRLEELVERKRTIFKWYKERLQEFEELQLATEKPGAKNNFWMSSLILKENCKINRDTFRLKLKERMVDTRPFFFPMSSLPMFRNQSLENPIAYSIYQRGVNLPSGHNLREDDVDYICEMIKEVLEKGSRYNFKQTKSIGPVDQILIEKNKSSEEELMLPFKTEEGKNAKLLFMTYETLQKSSDIEMLANWRQKNSSWFPSQFKITLEGTRTWLEKGVLDIKDRCLFWVIDSTGKKIGHIGLFRLSLDSRRIEIDNILRGEETEDKGLMRTAISKLLEWQRQDLKIPDSYLRVFSDNTRAIRLYECLGYKEIQRIPLKRIESPDKIEWKENFADPYVECDRYFITMFQKKK
jgi:dTDP-4-amino-4,6-dideoxygalactose transaminase/RimJ/RimL family protein N-acetyltransferase